MAIDDTKLEFSSNWDIDKLTTLQPVTVTIGSGDNAIYTIPDPANPPVWEIMAKYSNVWYQPGQNGILTGPKLSLLTWVDGGIIHVKTNKTVDIRLYVWQDTVNY